MMTDHIESKLATSIEELKQELAKDPNKFLEVVRTTKGWGLVCQADLVSSVQLKGNAGSAEQRCAEVLHAAANGFYEGMRFAAHLHKEGLKLDFDD